jgi:hypothetical protein
MQTSMPRTAPAKAAVADGIGLSAIPADMLPGTALNAEYRLGMERFGKRSTATGMGSEGAAVM